MKRLFLIALLLTSAMSIVTAQEETTDYFARYEGIPFSRTDDGGFVLGSPDAPVTIVEFADFMCPHCQDYQETAHEFIDTYVATGMARFEYRMFPIVHPTYSALTAQLAECAEQQRDGIFWPTHDVLYDLARNGDIGPNTAETLESTLGLDADKLEVCVETAEQYQIDSALGTSVGVTGTPATRVRLPSGELAFAFINNQVFDRGGLPVELLDLVVRAVDISDVTIIPTSMLADLIDADAECSAPCWHDITPGETAFETVGDTIREDRNFIEIEENPTQQENVFTLTWRTSTSNFQDPNYVVSDEAGVVDVISLVELQSFGLGDVIEAQGDPASALAVQSGETSVLLYVFYPEKSLVVLAFSQGTSVIDAATTIVGAQFFSPARMETVLASADPAPWEGFDAIDSYFR
jgi:hypothetical protein